MMYLAFWMAARVQSMLVPSVQKPWLSGGLTMISATSRLKIFRRNRFGISLRKMGVKSARPAFTAARTLPPMNSEFERKIPAAPRGTGSVPQSRSLAIHRTFLTLPLLK